ncbi:MAG: thioredoxin domain-containing protein [Pelagibacterales bacterium]|nr:thioredoxin domain-containing protein [Pelagibacterales bacterium]
MSCENEITINSMESNQLKNETSLYLKQHAENPVNWQRWSNTIFDFSGELNKLVIVSIGYSSCHWCHVMEDETFTDEKIAELMNDNFINIKVDREENPDVDQAYMTASQLMTGMGGWPLNVIALPDGSPIYAGTYHTKEQWFDILNRIIRLKENNYEGLEEIANNVKNGVIGINTITKKSEVSEFNKDFLTTNTKIWSDKWDLDDGGDIAQQKFISPSKYQYLLNYGSIYKDQETLNYVKKTLDIISNSGIVDSVEGGFYRYTVDPEWKVPHFEKMLYDQAQIISLYSNAYKLFRTKEYKDLVYQTINFIDSEMNSPNGLYYAAMDADTDGEEGKYYSFNENEIKLISGEQIELFNSFFNIDLSKPWDNNKFLLLPTRDIESWLSSNSLNKDAFIKMRDRWFSEIMKIKSKRTKPRIDDKTIVSWNALSIIGLIDAYDAFNDDLLLTKAKNMFDNLLNKGFKNNMLIHTFKEKQYQDGVLEDYAFLSKAAMRLFQTTGEEYYFNKSKEIVDNSIKYFKDEESDLLLYTTNKELFTKIVSIDDGVIPSPNSIIAEQLFNIGHIVFDDYYLDQSNKMVSSVKEIIDGNINSYSVWANNILNRVELFYEIAVIGKDSDSKTKLISEKLLPNVILVQSNTESEIPLFVDRYFEDETYIYVCQNKTCQRPETDIKYALEQIPYLKTN